MRKELFGICRLVLAVLVVGAAAIATSQSVRAGGNRESEGGNLGPGCAPERPAIAHHAGGVAVEDRRGEERRAPVPCSTRTGFRTSEVSIAVTNQGTVLVQPAFPQGGAPIGVLRSVDRGGSWEFIIPPTSPSRSTAIDMDLWVDRKTGRAFWSNDLIPPVGNAVTQRLDFSDDDGNTWFASSSLPIVYDHTQVFSGPPTKGVKHLLQGFPSVVYACVSGGFTCAARNFCGTHCTKSLDGGETFGPSVAIPYPPECPAPGVRPTGGYGLRGAIARDGTLYLPFTPCERPYVAISNDAGDTWRLSLVADTETIGWGELALGIDGQGNLYATWADAADRLPYLSISRDGASHWSTPLMIAAPGVNEVAEPLLLARANGQVAVIYYGSRNSPGRPFPPVCTGASVTCPGYQNETWSTYVTETWNALDRQPLFWSATLNDPARPTWYGVTPSSMRIPTGSGFAGGSSAGTQGGPSFAGRMDYFDAALGPDGTPWVGFVQECPFGLPVAGNPTCPSTLTGASTDGLFGLVGRLVRVGGEAEDHEDD